MRKEGILIVVSGFSGAGKGTLMKALCSRHSNYQLSVSATTRKPRICKKTGEQEVDGVDYYFLTKEEFESMIDKDELIEYACYQGNYYGTPRKFVEEKLAEGQDIILEIDVQGANKIKAKWPGAVLIFVTPPDIHELVNRLYKRGTESEEQIRGRLRRATEEAEFINAYDYLLINDDLDESVERLHHIIESAHFTTGRSSEIIGELTGELKGIMKGD